MYTPENEYGNIEYKLNLLNTSDTRLQSLTSQLMYRLNEGNGECIYVLGVTDKGVNVGLTDLEFKESFQNLSMIVKENNLGMSILSEKKIDTKKIYELFIRQHNNKYIDIKVTVAGAVDAGKSSLLGMLVSGKNDDGRGLSRLSIFNFKHEIQSGRTSSIAHHIIGFDKNGECVNKEDVYKKGWTEIIQKSVKIISLYDLCGHERYLKTTIFGLTSTIPDICLILIGSNMGITRITQEHIFLCNTLNIPFVILITKIDICDNRQNVLMDTVNSVNKLLKMPGLRKIPYKISNQDDVILCSKNIYSDSIVPIFHVSSVTGMGIPHLKMFFNLLKSNKPSVCNLNSEYYIDMPFNVNGVGTVVGGHLIRGTVNVNDKLFVGPLYNGEYVETQVKSIHCKQTPVQSISNSEYVCFALKKINKSIIRRGMVLVSSKEQCKSVYEFDATITVLKSYTTTIKPGYQTIVHVGNVRQAIKLISISHSSTTNLELLKTGDTATVKFSFMFRPEFIKINSKILMAEGKVKLIGTIITIYPIL